MQGGGYWIDGSYGADSWNITSTQTMALSRASAMTQLATPSTASQVPKEVISDTKRGVSGHFLFGSPNSPGVPGTIETQNPNNMTNSVTLSIFGSQAVQIQSQINQSIQNPPPYDVYGPSPTCDCAFWIQNVLGSAGINTGPPTIYPSTLIQQINQVYSLP
jgi:hypothetical protein